MKRIISNFKPYMVRPTIYKAITRCSIAMVLILLWSMFLNTSLSPVRDASFCAGLVFLMLAWFSYLRIDGMKVHFLGEEILAKKHPKKKKHWQKSMIDFVDEHIITFDELTEDEQAICMLATHLLSGIVFLAVSVFGMF